MPFVDVMGSRVKTVPLHIAATGANIDVIAAPIVATVIVNGVVHPLASFTTIVYVPTVRFRKILLV